MTRIKIENAKLEAARFIVAADELMDELDRDALEPRYYDEPGKVRATSPNDYSWGSAASGTLRRRSMDLTRTLAQLRK